MNQLQRVLIANRGEIAIRIARAAQALGTSVGVYPPVDTLSLHTRYANETRELPGGAGPGGVADYLDAPALVRIACETGCECVHPGNGFLAENPAFAARCAAAGLVFVGPTPATASVGAEPVPVPTRAQMTWAERAAPACSISTSAAAAAW